MTTATEMTEWLKSINNDYTRKPEIKNTREVDTTIVVGDSVRSFDFEFVDDCYIEGVVTEIKNERYVIKMTKKVFSGSDETKKYLEWSEGNGS